MAKKKTASKPQANQQTAKAFEVRRRGLHQQASRGRNVRHEKPIVAIRKALAVRKLAQAEPVLEWSGTDQVAVLDVDVHHGEGQPSIEAMEAIGRQIQPRPRLWWVSHGGGLHLVYAAAKGFTADELAAAARGA